MQRPGVHTFWDGRLVRSTGQARASSSRWWPTLVRCPAALRVTAMPRSLCRTFRSLPALTRRSVSRAIGTPLLCHAIIIACGSRPVRLHSSCLPPVLARRQMRGSRSVSTGRAHLVVQTGPVALPTRRSPAVLPTGSRPGSIDLRLSHVELCRDHDLRTCCSELSDDLGVRGRIGDH